MNLNDLFRELALGELSNLSMSENDTIISRKRPQITSYANEGLLDLHSRFILKEKDVIVEMREGVTNYHLLKRYSLSYYDDENPPDRWDIPYIMDTPAEPFLEDVIKILSVYNSYGIKLPLNDLKSQISVFNPQSNVLQVPYPIAAQSLSIEYQAEHTQLDHCDCDEEIQLPKVLWPALKSYVASKVCSHMNTQEMTAKGQEHSVNYENKCLDITEMDLVNSSSHTTNTQFEERGWI